MAEPSSDGRRANESGTPYRHPGDSQGAQRDLWLPPDEDGTGSKTWPQIQLQAGIPPDETGIQSVIRRKKKRYLPSTPQYVAENILNREFLADKPNQKWVTDVTEFKYGIESKAYLSAIRDLHDGSIVSYVLGRSNNNALVFETLDQALRAEPGAKPILHSDRGFQYTSRQFKIKLDKAGIMQSMSRVGRCIDNSPMESFWGALKCEEYYLRTYQSFDELKNAIDAYIRFYNHERLQERLNGLSPIEYRTEAA